MTEQHVGDNIYDTYEGILEGCTEQFQKLLSPSDDVNPENHQYAQFEVDTLENICARSPTNLDELVTYSKVKEAIFQLKSNKSYIYSRTAEHLR